MTHERGREVKVKQELQSSHDESMYSWRDDEPSRQQQHDMSVRSSTVTRRVGALAFASESNRVESGHPLHNQIWITIVAFRTTKPCLAEI